MCVTRFTHDPNREIFNWVSKVIPDCLDFALLRYVIGSETRAFLSTNQIENKKAIVTWPLAFSRASDNSVSFTLRPHWLPVIFSCPLIGWCDYFGFGFATFNQMHCNGLHWLNEILYGSVLEQRNTKSRGLRFDSSRGFRSFLCPTLVRGRKPFPLYVALVLVFCVLKPSQLKSNTSQRTWGRRDWPQMFCNDSKSKSQNNSRKIIVTPTVL